MLSILDFRPVSYHHNTGAQKPHSQFQDGVWTCWVQYIPAGHHRKCILLSFSRCLCFRAFTVPFLVSFLIPFFNHLSAKQWKWSKNEAKNESKMTWEWLPWTTLLFLTLILPLVSLLKLEHKHNFAGVTSKYGLYRENTAWPFELTHFTCSQLLAMAGTNVIALVHLSHLSLFSCILYTGLLLLSTIIMTMTVEVRPLIYMIYFAIQYLWWLSNVWWFINRSIYMPPIYHNCSPFLLPLMPNFAFSKQLTP